MANNKKNIASSCIFILFLGLVLLTVFLATRPYSPPSNTTSNSTAVNDKIHDLAPTSKNKVIVGYFPNWLKMSYLPTQIEFSSYTHIYYAFALQVVGNTPTWKDRTIFEAETSYSFQTLVKLAKASGVKVILSIGGWTGSTAFSPMVSTASSRAEFIQWNIDFMNRYGTDGVDIDWEYPTDSGPGCNAYNTSDVTNLLSLVKELRASFDHFTSYKEITMAVHITPWSSKNNSKSMVSSFVPYVDRFHVMAFDINGSWNSTSGPNAPFKAQPGYGYPYGFVDGIEMWHAAGVPYNKIAGGVPFYGRARKLVNVSSAPSTQYNLAASEPPLGDSDDGPWSNPYCSSDTSSASGEWKYKNLRAQALLTSPTTAASPWIRNFDNYTQTPWLYNPTNKQYISYDDPVSIGVKTQWAIQNDLAGLFCWSIEQDNGELLTAMKLILSNNQTIKSV